jgi:hypothetical protein
VDGTDKGDHRADSVETNKSETIEAGRNTIKVFIGGRDDAFFNDLPGFFRSINYAPQFYNIPLSMANARELPIPKTLLELEGNDLFNFDPANPELGYTIKKDLPPGPWTWKGNKFKKDEKGKYRFVYSGKDNRAGKNVNAIILEIPLAFITKTPEADRIVNSWGESWVLKASGKIEVHVLTDAERKAWIAKLMPVHTEMQSRFGKDFIEKIYKASGFTPPSS